MRAYGTRVWSRACKKPAGTTRAPLALHKPECCPNVNLTSGITNVYQSKLRRCALLPAENRKLNTMLRVALQLVGLASVYFRRGVRGAQSACSCGDMHRLGPHQHALHPAQRAAAFSGLGTPACPPCEPACL